MTTLIFTYPFEHKMRLQNDRELNYLNTLIWLKSHSYKFRYFFVQNSDEYFMFWNFSDNNDEFYNKMVQLKRQLIHPKLYNIVDSIKPEQKMHCITDSNQHIVIERSSNKYNLKFYGSTSHMTDRTLLPPI
jgi:hypothetical protein